MVKRQLLTPPCLRRKFAAAGVVHDLRHEIICYSKFYRKEKSKNHIA